VLLSDRPGSRADAGKAPSATGGYTATAPWRLRVQDNIKNNDVGCTVTLSDPSSGAAISLVDALYGSAQLQIHQTGRLTWVVSDPGCLVAPAAGSGSMTLPATLEATAGDSDAFPVTSGVAVQVKDFLGSAHCSLKLLDPANGQLLDFHDASPVASRVVLQPGPAHTAYLDPDGCGVQISASS
jgi:eukaryotic-like serine/threonine-protein kinase